MLNQILMVLISIDKLYTRHLALLTGEPGGPTLPADPGNPVAPLKSNNVLKSQHEIIYMQVLCTVCILLTGGPCVPLPPFSPGTP